MPLLRSRFWQRALTFTFSSLLLYAGTMPTSATQALNLPYQSAPAPLDKMLASPFLPALSLAPDRRAFVLLEHQSLPELAELAAPELRLAGLRINPRNFAPSRNWFYTQLQLQTLDETGVNGPPRPVTGLPEHPHLSNVHWSPDGRYLAFSQTTDTTVELWLLDTQTAQARKLSDKPLNKTYDLPFVWAPDSRSLICKMATRSLPLPPAAELPTGPVIMENTGRPAPGRTYQDLLKSPEDEARFKYYLHSQLWRIDLQGQAQALGKPGLIASFQASPDGHYLLVKQWHEPFSYMFPSSRFPLRSEIWNAQGQVQQVVADLPLANKIPISFDAARPGRRQIDWRPDRPASLYWIEALDGGDPNRDMLFRDRLWNWPAPFETEPQTLLDLPQRFESAYWKNESLALIYTQWYGERRRNIWRLAPGQPQTAAKVRSYSSENRYQAPGYPLLERNAQGRSLLMTQADGQTLLLRGQGASPEGERPFLDAWNPFTGHSQRLWQSQAPWYERPVQVLNPGLADPTQTRVLLRRESRTEPPNYYLRALAADAENLQLTQFSDPLPEFSQVHKELLSYTRKDGVPLTATLYLPPGYHRADGPLPTVIWAYPNEFKNPQAAGQVKGSPYSYVRLNAWSPLVFLTQGYAVLDHPSMPIIGEGLSEPNDHYIEQLVASAQAAVDTLVKMGVSDRKRIAIGGHSYGAFMAANLLAHSDLFRAGIARSGAYNRTLTPFGFQSEQRSLWQAPEVYLRMSPLMYADQIKAPLLLIHGEADNNSGTYPMQSQYFYQALKGLGAPVRLVMLPYESHSYRARESLGHMLWEMVNWLDTYVKNPPQ